MNCKELTNDKLIDYKEGVSAGKAGINEIAEHLSACPACRGRMENIGALSSILAKTFMQDETEIPPSVDAAVKQEIGNISAMAQMRKKSFFGLAAATAAACLAIGLGLTLVMKISALHEAKNEISSLNGNNSGLEQALQEKNSALSQQELKFSELRDISVKEVESLRQSVSQLNRNITERESQLAGEIQEGRSKAEELIAETRRLNKALSEKDNVMDELRGANAALAETVKKREDLIAQSAGIIQQMDALKQQISFLKEKLGITKALIGDANSDGAITIADAQIITSFILQQKNPDDIKQFDLNKDGKVDVADTMLIARLILER